MSFGKKLLIFVVFGFLAAAASAAQAGVITSGGWQIASDDSVDITDLLFVGTDRIVLEKFASFSSLNPLHVTFTKVSANAVNLIAINDEHVFNDVAGVTWTGFQLSLSNGATFDEAKSIAFGGTPFTAKAYSAGDTLLTMTGGSLPDTLGLDEWHPQGGLFFVPSSGGVGTSFVLTEQPVPEPVSLGALGGLGLLALRRHRA